MYSGKRSFLLTIVSPKPQTPQDRSRKANSLKITIVGSGFPHSDISGSKLVRSSPELFAAYHVLHRLSVPRHPPNALKTLDRSHCRYSPLAIACGNCKSRTAPSHSVSRFLEEKMARGMSPWCFPRDAFRTHRK